MYIRVNVDDCQDENCLRASPKIVRRRYLFRKLPLDKFTEIVSMSGMKINKPMGIRYGDLTTRDWCI